MIYDDLAWNYRIARRHNRNNRSDRIWFHVRSHPRRGWVRPVRLRGNVLGVHRVVP
jgi:hypothetical protein